MAIVIAGIVLTPAASAWAYTGDAYMSGTGGWVAVVVDEKTGETVKYGDDYDSERKARRAARKMAREMNGVVDNGEPECQVVLC